MNVDQSSIGGAGSNVGAGSSTEGRPRRAAQPGARARRLAIAFVGGFVLHNLSPYVGFRRYACQTMYSDLSSVAPGNHWFLPRLRWFDFGEYYGEPRVVVTTPGGDTQTVDVFGRQRNKHHVRREHLRGIIRRLCDANNRVAFDYRDGDAVSHVPNACDDPAHSRPHNLALGESFFPTFE